MKPIDFGDYQLIKKLATGGMGEVFLARQQQGAGFERYVAIKRILPELSGDDEFVRMFLDEARLAARLNHPNVVQIYDLGICGDQYYLAMEFLEGRDLRRIMGRLGTQRRALPIVNAVQIIYGAAEGLHYAHHLKDPYGKPLNIVHRDVSPQNIYVSFHGTIKVLDFGIAKAEARSVRTRTGGLKGKYPYLSPEQVRGENVDYRSDVFSLGTVLWEVTVGRRLFKRDNDLLTLQAVLHCEIPRPSQLVDEYPPELEKIVLKSLARYPDKRYQSCRELQEALEQFTARQGLVQSPQRLGGFVEELFPDEPRTVTDILEDLRKKPTSRSLLHDEGESSESVSHAPEISGLSNSALAPQVPHAGQIVDDSGSHSLVPPRPSSHPPGEGSAAAVGLVEMFNEFEGLNFGGEPDFAASSAPAPAPELPRSPRRQRPPVASIKPPPPAPPPAPVKAPPAPSPPEEAEAEEAPAISRAPTAIGVLAPAPQELDDLDIDVEDATLDDLAEPSAPGLFESSAPGVAASWESEELEPITDKTARPVEPRRGGAVEALRRHPVMVVLLVLVIFAAPVFLFLLSGLSGDGNAAPRQSASDGERTQPIVVPEQLSGAIPNQSPPEPSPPLVTADARAETPDAAAEVPAPPPEAPAGDAAPPPSGESPSAGRDAETAPTHSSDAPQRTPARQMATLYVSTVPSGLRVSAAGRRVGTSPTKVSLPAGTHRINVRGQTQGIDHSVTVSLSAGGTHRENIVIPSGELSLRVRPYAKVFVDGRSLGLTPMPPVKVFAGRHRVRLVNDSLNRSIVRTVVVRPGQRATLSVNMSED